MKPAHSKKLIVKVLVLGVAIAILGYLFHPDVGQLAVSFNGEPVAQPLVRLAAIPAFLAMLLLTGLVVTLVFVGVGMLMLMTAVGFALLMAVVFMPYFWPILAIIFLVIAMMSVGHDDKTDR